MKKGQASLMTALDGYRRLAVDADSRLGWRIITLFFGFGGCDDLVRRALQSGEDIVPELPKEYRDEHLVIAELVRKAPRRRRALSRGGRRCRLRSR